MTNLWVPPHTFTALLIKVVSMTGLIIVLSIQQLSADETAQNTETKLSLMTLVPDLTPISDYRGDIGNRSTLFGDVSGKRQDLYEKGITFDAKLTQIIQGVTSGGKDSSWKYSGNSDYYLFLDSGRLGLWPGGLVGIHAQSRFGHSVNSKTGAISPVNSSSLWPYPGQDSTTFLSEYYLTQGLTKTLAVTLGRLDWVGVADKSYFANNGQTQFMNMSLRNSTLLGTFFPLTAHGIAFAYQPVPDISITPFAVSQNDQPDVNGSPGGLFDEVTFGAEVDITWKIKGLPGAFRPGLVYGTKDPTALDNNHLIFDAIRGTTLPEKNGNWLININFDQFFYTPEHPVSGPKTADFDANPEGIGVFFRFAFTPEDRNPWNMSVSGGIGGRGVIPGRHNDRYGVGFYALIASDDLEDQLIIGNELDSEWGLEAFYNIAITPWLQISPDIQYIQSGLPDVDDSVVLATRVQMYF